MKIKDIIIEDEIDQNRKNNDLMKKNEKLFNKHRKNKKKNNVNISKNRNFSTNNRNHFNEYSNKNKNNLKNIIKNKENDLFKNKKNLLNLIRNRQSVDKVKRNKSNRKFESLLRKLKCGEVKTNEENLYESSSENSENSENSTPPINSDQENNVTEKEFQLNKQIKIKKNLLKNNITEKLRFKAKEFSKKVKSIQDEKIKNKMEKKIVNFPDCEQNLQKLNYLEKLKKSTVSEKNKDFIDKLDRFYIKYHNKLIMNKIENILKDDYDKKKILNSNNFNSEIRLLNENDKNSNNSRIGTDHEEKEINREIWYLNSEVNKNTKKDKNKLLHSKNSRNVSQPKLISNKIDYDYDFLLKTELNVSHKFKTKDNTNRLPHNRIDSYKLKNKNFDLNKNLLTYSQLDNPHKTYCKTTFSCEKDNSLENEKEDFGVFIDEDFFYKIKENLKKTFKETNDKIVNSGKIYKEVIKNIHNSNKNPSNKYKEYSNVIKSFSVNKKFFKYKINKCEFPKRLKSYNNIEKKKLNQEELTLYNKNLSKTFMNNYDENLISQLSENGSILNQDKIICSPINKIKKENYLSLEFLDKKENNQIQISAEKDIIEFNQAVSIKNIEEDKFKLDNEIKNYLNNPISKIKNNNNSDKVKLKSVENKNLSKDNAKKVSIFLENLNNKKNLSNLRKRSLYDYFFTKENNCDKNDKNDDNNQKRDLILNEKTGKFLNRKNSKNTYNLTDNPINISSEYDKKESNEIYDEYANLLKNLGVYKISGTTEVDSKKIINNTSINITIKKKNYFLHKDINSKNVYNNIKNKGNKNKKEIKKPVLEFININKYKNTESIKNKNKNTDKKIIKIIKNNNNSSINYNTDYLNSITVYSNKKDIINLKNTSNDTLNKNTNDSYKIDNIINLSESRESDNSIFGYINKQSNEIIKKKPKIVDNELTNENQESKETNNHYYLNEENDYLTPNFFKSNINQEKIKNNNLLKKSEENIKNKSLQEIKNQKANNIMNITKYDKKIIKIENKEKVISLIMNYFAERETSFHFNSNKLKCNKNTIIYEIEFTKIVSLNFSGNKNKNSENSFYIKFKLLKGNFNEFSEEISRIQNILI